MLTTHYCCGLPVCLSVCHIPVSCFCCLPPPFTCLSDISFWELRFICGNTFRSYSCCGYCCCSCFSRGLCGKSFLSMVLGLLAKFFMWFSCCRQFWHSLECAQGEEGNFKQIGAVRAPFFVCLFDFCFQFYALITLMNTFVLGQRQADMTGLMFCWILSRLKFIDWPQSFPRLCALFALSLFNNELQPGWLIKK